MPSSDPDRTSGHIHVFIVDDHPAICEAVKDTLASTMDIEFCGQAESYEKGFRRIEELEPDVAIIDISLSDGHGLDLVSNLQAQVPDVGIVVFSMYDEKVYAERAIRAGASGYLMKTESTEKLVQAIRRVERGETAVSQRMASRILNRMVRGDSSQPSFPIDALTDRELEVFQMLGQGKSVEEIQDALNLSRKTIETYRRRAKEKLGFDNVSQLVQYAVQWTHGQGTGGQTSNVMSPRAPESVEE